MQLAEGSTGKGGSKRQLVAPRAEGFGQEGESERGRSGKLAEINSYYPKKVRIQAGNYGSLSFVQPSLTFAAGASA